MSLSLFAGRAVPTGKFCLLLVLHTFSRLLNIFKINSFEKLFRVTNNLDPD